MIEWISVKDRLPRPGQQCLLYRPDAPATRDPVWRIAVFNGEQFACLVQPTHWAELSRPRS